jgi:hypothetical protein
MHHTSFELEADQLPTLCANYNPRMDMSKAPAELPAGGMMALMMDPDNRDDVEAMFDGLKATRAVEPLRRRLVHST